MEMSCLVSPMENWAELMLISSQQWSVPQGTHSRLPLILNLFETKKRKKKRSLWGNWSAHYRECFIIWSVLDDFPLSSMHKGYMCKDMLCSVSSFADKELFSHGSLVASALNHVTNGPVKSGPHLSAYVPCPAALYRSKNYWGSLASRRRSSAFIPLPDILWHLRSR